MSDDYAAVRTGTLKLKGKRKNIFKSDKSKKKAKKDDESEKVDVDSQKNGGWWRIADEVDLKGGIHIALECGEGSRRYLSAMDNGRFTVGFPRDEGDGPAPEEIFAVVKTPDETKFSLKTGYDKFIGVNASGQLVATAEAIGPRERFVAVFQEGKSAIQAICNSMFLSFKEDKTGEIYVASKTATEDEMVNIRTNVERSGPVDWRPDEDKKSAKDCETSYVKMFQHSKVDLKGRHIAVDVNDRTQTKKAQKHGDLHAHLLDRRMKMKSDRYC